MTVQEILDQLDSHGFTKITTALKLNFVNDVYMDVISREPWPFMEGISTITLVNGNNTPTLPADFGKVISFVGDGILGPLSWERKDRLANRYSPDGGLTTSGVPNYFYFDAGVMKVYPVPNAGYTTYLTYIKKPTPLLQTDIEATILLPARHHRILVVGALDRLHKLERRPEVAAAYKAEFDERYQTMHTDLFTRQYDSPDYIEVVDPEEWNYENPGP